MLRILPSGTRIIPAFLITFLTTFFLYKLLSSSSAPLLHSSDQCDIDGNCEAPTAKDLLKPPTRAELQSLRESLNLLKQDMEALKRPPPKELTPDELQWEARRKECGDGVIRNIDYQHVPHLQSKITVERCPREILGISIKTILDQRKRTMA